MVRTRGSGIYDWGARGVSSEIARKAALSVSPPRAEVDRTTALNLGSCRRRRSGAGCGDLGCVRPKEHGVCPIAALVLGAIERLIGSFKDGCRLHIGRGQAHGDADTYGEELFEWRGVIHQGQFADGIMEPASGLESAVGVGLRQQEHELLASEAGQQVVRAAGLGIQNARQSHQALVSKDVAVQIVNGLEVIHVHQQEGQRDSDGAERAARQRQRRYRMRGDWKHR